MALTGQDWLNAGTGIVGGAITGITQGIMNKKTREFNQQEAEKQRQWNETMADKQNAWNYDMWMKTNEYNSPIEQIQRLRDAGLNPLYYGLDGSSANGLEAAQPLGYERAEADNQANPMSAGLDAYSNIRSMQKDIELKNAQIDKLKEDTKGVGLDNEWKDKTMAARVKAEEIKNEISEEELKKVKQEIENMKQDLKKKIAETDNEIAKKALIESEAALNRASEKEILELLPYRILLMEAQTEAEKADAAMKWAQAAYQNKIIDSGYIDWMADEMKHQAKIADYNEGITANKVQQSAAEAKIERWKESIKTGTMFDDEKFFGRVGNVFFGGISTMSEALGGSLVPIISAGLVGRGASKAGNSAKPTPGNPTISAQSTVLYGPDNKPWVTANY